MWERQQMEVGLELSSKWWTENKWATDRVCRETVWKRCDWHVAHTRGKIKVISAAEARVLVFSSLPLRQETILAPACTPNKQWPGLQHTLLIRSYQSKPPGVNQWGDAETEIRPHEVLIPLCLPVLNYKGIRSFQLVKLLFIVCSIFDTQPWAVQTD